MGVFYTPILTGLLITEKVCILSLRGYQHNGLEIDTKVSLWPVVPTFCSVWQPQLWVKWGRLFLGNGCVAESFRYFLHNTIVSSHSWVSHTDMFFRSWEIVSLPILLCVSLKSTISPHILWSGIRHTQDPYQNSFTNYTSMSDSTSGLRAKYIPLWLNK